ncbi:MAG: slipin family protein [Anaerolineae bacterium]|jgi:regulator of protease activity HflC (stomatin/prohibitin superfamily)
MEDERAQDRFAAGAEFQFKAFNVVSLMMALVTAILGVTLGQLIDDWRWGIPLYLLAFFFLLGFKVAQHWERAVILRLGKFRRVAGPGAFWIIPLVDSIAAWIDHRVMVTPFGAEKTLTRDTVPVNVDAVLFWVIWDGNKAALEVKDYRAAVYWAAQTALRDIIGKMDLADILVGREKIDVELQEIIDRRSTPWGITVESVEIRDIVIPEGLENAMSRQAQAERERQARIILGQAEQQIAQSFVEAAKFYKDEPIALRLRSLNMIMEGVKERGSLVVVPYEEASDLGTTLGLTAARRKIELADKE